MDMNIEFKALYRFLLWGFAQPSAVWIETTGVKVYKISCVRLQLFLLVGMLGRFESPQFEVSTGWKIA